nr:MAG TPA: hypothetical protein [Caudoviricetes sp.]
MSECKRYMVLDVNNVPIIYRNVLGKVVKCCAIKPIGPVYDLDNLLLTEDEIKKYDSRLLAFAYKYEKRGLYEFMLEKAFN